MDTNYVCLHINLSKGSLKRYTDGHLTLFASLVLLWPSCWCCFPLGILLLRLIFKALLL